MDFINQNLEYIVPLVIAILGVGAFFSYKKSKSKKITQKNITTKSGDVVGGNKTTNK
ncbi:hypothetical protein [Maribacter halichondriae]|uniref:hypothetical protein n=1 Tax=Maribacter halichondriae TaxID=2980554 RepID=UPI002359660A|nr:hypothetical protein [Maribacter sp. Hal144]